MANGVDGAGAKALYDGLAAKGAVPRYVGVRLGTVTTEEGEAIEVDSTFEIMPSVLWDAVAVPDGRAAAVALGTVGHAVEFLKDQFRHAKPILACGAGCDLAENAGVAAALPSGKPDPGVIASRKSTAEKLLPAFLQAIARHRHHEREMDPPAV